jgi:hypothetical protein
MKKLAGISFLFFFAFQTLLGKTYFPADEWYVEGPGGAYGVLAWNTEGAIVMLGPIEINSPFSFQTTRILFILVFIVIGIVLCLLTRFLIKRKGA